MKREFSFRVFGDPKGQPRARAFRRGNHTGVYDPGTADAWKFAVREAARETWNRDLGGETFGKVPIYVGITFFFRRPKSHWRKCKQLGETLKSDAPKWHTSKPDRDNCEKAILDALTTLGIWEDDSQVCCGQVFKRYADHAGLPGAVVVIGEANE